MWSLSVSCVRFFPIPANFGANTPRNRGLLVARDSVRGAPIHPRADCPAGPRVMRPSACSNPFAAGAPRSGLD
nr:unnamed protein product [Callosobruchus chinensis]